MKVDSGNQTLAEACINTANIQNTYILPHNNTIIINIPSLNITLSNYSIADIDSAVCGLLGIASSLLYATQIPSHI